MIRKSIFLIILLAINQFTLGQRIAIATKAMGAVEINKKAKPGSSQVVSANRSGVDQRG